MSLTTGRGPLSPRPAGRLIPPAAAGTIYVEPFARRVRGRRGGATLIDSQRVVLVHRPGQPPTYAFPAEDVATTPADRSDDRLGVEVEDDDALAGYVRVPWAAMDEWLEEDEPVSGHPRNPYHRIDCLHTSRHLRVTIGEVVLVEVDETIGLYETALAPRLYVRPDQVRMDLLTPSDTTTYCPYKGTASYLDAVVDGTTVADVAWCYRDPSPEAEPIRGLLSFDDQRVEVNDNLPPALDLSDHRDPAA